MLNVLPLWIKASGPTLRNLRIICKASTHVTDGLLESLSPDLLELEHLSIIGCPKVTHKGIGALVSTNRSGLLAIDLKHLSLSFDMSAFTTLCNRAQAFRRLHTITLTVPANTSMFDWTRDVYDLLSSAPLEVFQLSSMCALSDRQMAGDFWQKMVTSHGSRLKRISFHRIQTSMTTLHNICSQCPRLEQLFVVAERRDLETLASSVSLARNLRTLHINYPLARNEAPISPATAMQTALLVSLHCSPTLTSIGLNTQMWQVSGAVMTLLSRFDSVKQVRRVVRIDENGEEHVEPILLSRENPEIPEQFLVSTM